MRKEKRINFVLLLRDETFLKRVKDTVGLDNQIDILEREYPAERGILADAIEFVRINLSDQRIMQPDDVSTIWEKIRLYGLSKKRRYTIERFLSYDLWKVAALLIVVLVSSVFVYHRLTGDSLQEIASVATVADGEAMIILSDGSKHKLESNQAHVEYSADGAEVVVKKDQGKEKIENLNTSKAGTINQIIVPFGHRHSITLSDGTRVQLNAGSRLVFPAEFTDGKREVYLKGEGYFEVSKNPDKPFIVKTDFFDTKVLGTVFDISAYDDEQIGSAVLVEGKVVVIEKKKLFGNTQKELSPGQGCFYSSSKLTSEIRKVDVNEYVSWKDGLFLFNDKPLISIVGRIEKYYNKRILVEGIELSTMKISGKLILANDIEKILQHLSKAIEARYEINEEGVYEIKN